jgi:hypothetical protein
VYIQDEVAEARATHSHVEACEKARKERAATERVSGNLKPQSTDLMQAKITF